MNYVTVGGTVDPRSQLRVPEIFRGRFLTKISNRERRRRQEALRRGTAFDGTCGHAIVPARAWAEATRESDLHRSDQTGGSLVDRLDRGDAWRQLSGPTREELLETLGVTIAEALELNRCDARETAGEGFEEISIAV